MKVRVIRAGYYDHVRRREGDVFELKPVKGKKVEIVRDKEGNKVSQKLVDHLFTPEEQFSETWMSKVGKSEGVTAPVGAQAALNAETKALKSGKSRSNDAEAI